jgi:uncharacterized protein YndB with AHSA1/START domain
MSDEREAIVVDADLEESPDKVWRALTEPELRSRWLAEADACAEIVEAEPGERLKLAWREADEAGRLIESDVTFTLTPTIGGGTRLRLVHDGFVRTPVMALAGLSAAMRRRTFDLGALKWAA